MAVGIRLDETVKGVRIIRHEETPGLGARVAENEFLESFVGRHLENLVLNGESGGIDAVTGATISSRAVVDTVREEVQRLVEALTEVQG
jgi:electron transport complex protein RnfG